MKAFYFGCRNGATGHYLHNPDGNWTPIGEWSALKMPFRWQVLDGGFAPRTRRSGVFFARTQLSPGEEIREGQAALHHVKGWTIVSFWDRSVDHRGGSCSSFILEGEMSWDAAWDAVRETFPAIVARYKFDIQHVATKVWESTEELQ